ncbi:hydantoinase B/oxoprolinase family protein [uncultured Zhongshania sp.]|uniref:hydantoinase B/oxoprolinase family protein n=1 Tax=uncultured Zhongshania sp. TaxID=1642288 RepID=UPI0025EA0948|nr:hydantoinase B/oxoprolinase family protein [uncultured Zhongshania sp.]|tara:strand:- start:329 stop:2575 length:2247 start_codon:yes stop_codon:yes gene_type:complete
MSTNLVNPDTADDQELVDRFLSKNRAFLGPDPEIQRNHHVAARSLHEEQVLSAGVDSHLYAEIRSGLRAALDETFKIAEMTVASPAAQCADMSTGYFTAAGDLSLASTRGVAGFTVSLHYPIRFIRKYFEADDTVGINEGDGFLLNDAHYGGIHSPDQHLFMPIFHDGKIVSWCVCAMHEGEIGARVPGGMGPMIESPWDEGLRGSPIKMVENYALKTDLVTFFQNSCREPQTMLADLKARLAACCRMERRGKEHIARYGIDSIVGFLRSNVEFMRDEGRRRIAELPDGTVRTQFYIDDTMREPALLKVMYCFTVKGDKVIVDLRGSSPELFNRPINSLLSTQVLGVAITLAHHIWPDMPCAQAIIDCFEFITDPGSIADCSDQVPVALCIQPMFKIMTAAELAFAKLYFGAPKKYGKTKAGWFNQPAAIIYGGVTQHQDSCGNMCGDLNGMAGGAKCDEDGEHSIAPCFGANVDIGESEDAEEKLPFIYAISKRIWPGNCGFGKFRGGAAYEYGLMRYGEQPFGFQTFTGGSYFPSTFGLYGGYACPTYGTVRVRGKNLFNVLKETPELFEASMASIMNDRLIEGAEYSSHSMAVAFELYPEGELFMTSQGGGGGYGDVLDRDPEMVIKDLEEGLIRAETASDLYGVVYDTETYAIDEAETAKRRTEILKGRLAQGISWDEFMATRVNPEPPPAVPFFGRWNNSEELYCGPFGKALPSELPPIIMPDPKDVEIQQLKSQLAALQTLS